MKLISMTDFVLEQKGDNLKYAQFLKQPLNLGMFVPCDLEGNVLEQPIIPWQDNIEHEGLHNMYKSKLKQYQQAKERVLFEDIKVIRNSHNFFIIEPTKGTIFYRILKNNTTVAIEDLFKLRTDITLTKSAQKQLGL